MMNVRGIRYLPLLILSVFALPGCEDPSPSVASLGKKFQAPKLTGVSPFDQDMKVNGYVRFQGSCDPRVTDVYLSLDNTTWFMVPAVPVTTGTNLTGSEVNDASCDTDGHFDFYLTKTDLTGWGYDPNANVDSIYLHGKTIIGDTQVLRLQDPHPGSGVATQVVLEKNWPTGFAGSGQCEYFNASIRDANNYFTTTAANVTFSIDRLIASTASPSVLGYANQADCLAGINSATTFTILGGKNSQFIYYRMPDAPLNGTISFRASNVSLPTKTSPYVDVTLRDSTTALFWITSYAPNKIGKGMCTKANFDARLYNGSQKYFGVTNAWTPVVSGSNSNLLLFYSDATCANIVTAIDGSSGNTTFYMKYTGTETNATNLTMSIAHTVNVAAFGNYDDIPQKIEIDRSGDTTLSRFDFFVQDIISRGMCNQTQLQTYNNQGTLVTPNITVNFASSAGATYFASQADCSNNINAISSLFVTNPQTSLYYRAFGVPGTNQGFTFTATGLTAAVRTSLISDKATTVTALLNGARNFTYPSANVCTPLVFEAFLSDTANDGAFYTNNFGEIKTIGINLPTGYTLYSDAGCGTAEPGNSMGVSIAVGSISSGQFTKYIKADSTPVAGNFNVFQSTGGATGYLQPTAPGLIVGP